MKKFEYVITSCSDEKLSDELNLFGADGWELVNMIMFQKVKSVVGINKNPVYEPIYKLIFKREKL